MLLPVDRLGRHFPPAKMVFPSFSHCLSPPILFASGRGPFALFLESVDLGGKDVGQLYSNVFTPNGARANPYKTPFHVKASFQCCRNALAQVPLALMWLMPSGIQGTWMRGYLGTSPSASTPSLKPSICKIPCLIDPLAIRRGTECTVDKHRSLCKV